MVATKKIWPIERRTSRETATCAAELDVTRYLGFARSIARSYARYFGGSIEDATGVAILGLLAAHRLWNPNEGAFATFAAVAMRRTLRRYAAREQRRNGVAVQDRVSRFAYVAARPQQAHSFAVVAIDAPLYAHDGDPVTAADILADESPPPDESLGERQEAEVARQRIAEALPCLDPRERLIIERRFLCDEDDPVTLRALGAELGISAEYVRQIEARALERLRDALAGRPPSQRAAAPLLVASQRAHRERRIVEARIEAAVPVPQRVLAKELGVTGSRVSQIEKEIRHKLKRTWTREAAAEPELAVAS